ncbi:MAG: hypothetical protein ACTSV7_15005 [Candidatus Baldrarchaeia archaeon]
MKELKFDKKDFMEDSLLNNETLEFIEALHSRGWTTAKIEFIARHKKVNGLEIDAVLVLKLNTCRRLIGLELKEYNFFEAIGQAIERRPYFHYFYLITRFPRSFLGFVLKEVIEKDENAWNFQRLKKLFPNKIGWICYDKRKGPFLFMPSFFQKCDVKYLLNLNKEIVDFEVVKTRRD